MTCPIGRGNRTGYLYGCRCDECRAASNASRKAWRHRQRDMNSPKYQAELATARKAKERYRGACEVCGKPTTGCNGPGRAPKRCVKHASVEAGLARRGTGPVKQRILAEIRSGNTRYTDIYQAVGITKSHAAMQLNKLCGYGIIERVARGQYRIAA